MYNHFASAFLVTLCLVVVCTFLLKSDRAQQGDKPQQADQQMSVLEISRNFRNADNSTNLYAVCFLMVNEDIVLLHWLERLVKDQITIFIMTDNNEFVTGFEKKENIIVLSVNSFLTLKAGYHKMSFLQRKPVHAWDKALFYFNRLSHKKYKFIWFIESDVYIPTIKAFLTVHRHAQKKKYDLVTKENIIEKSPRNSTQWHWPVISKTFVMPTPWYASLSCAIGLSADMMTLVDKYAAANSRLDFLETLFNTIAMHNNMSIWNPLEMESIECCKLAPWTCDEIESREHKWIHPIKDIRKFIGECFLLDKPWLHRVFQQQQHFLRMENGTMGKVMHNVHFQNMTDSKYD